MDVQLAAAAALTARVVSPTAVEITWTRVNQSDDGSRYFLRYAPQAHRKSHKTMEVKDTSTIVNSLDPDVTYVFKVRKYKGDKPEPWSDIVLVTTNLQG